MRARSRGAALGVVMILLAGLGALALGAAAAAMTALALAGHQQAAALAFEAAEAGIAESLAVAASSAEPRAGGETPYPDATDPVAWFATQTSAIQGAGPLPEGFSAGENTGGFRARQFRILADAGADRGARVRLEQGFYVVEPAS